jgi:ribosome-binding protein aMBF1 (putative translation factor)
MSDLKKYVKERKKRDSLFADGYEIGYDEFKIGVILKSARKKAGLSQEQIAKKLHTKKTAISRLENHSTDFRLSTIKKYAEALGKKLYISFR